MLCILPLQPGIQTPCPSTKQTPGITAGVAVLEEQWLQEMLQAQEKLILLPLLSCYLSAGAAARAVSAIFRQKFFH